MKDFEEGEQCKIELIREKFKHMSSLYGFSFMDPSPIELLSVLETKSGQEIRNEIYYFTDKGGREIALRFDFTVGLTRYIASQKSARLPIKVSSFGGVFRYDEPQKGRYRYFHQWDIEVYGRIGLESEAEIIELTSRLFDSLNLTDIIIDINHRNLVESYINRIFESDDAQLTGDILRAVDKTQKKPRDEILKEFEEKGYDRSKLDKILDFSRLCGTISEIESRFDTSVLESWNDLKSLFASLQNRGVSNIRVNFGIVRGLDYYSGVVFEVFEKNSRLALAGGGRYDSLTDAFGRKDIGAAGVAGGVERMMLAMDQQGAWPSTRQETTSVLYVNEEMQRTAVGIASALRLRRIVVDIDLAGRPLKKQMDLASGSKFAIIVGPKEAESGNILLRNMEDGTETLVGIEKIKTDPHSVLNQ